MAQLRKLCAEVSEEDGVVQHRRPEKNHKKSKYTQHFCGEVCRFLNTLLPSAADPVLQQTILVQATLSGEQLRIEVQSTSPLALNRLVAARGWLRSEIALYVPTRRLPELFFSLYHEETHETP